MKLKKLRDKMINNSIDFYIVPTFDPHGSEYIPENYKEREFITGFTGSAGVAIISLSEAYLWTDGRYFIQAEEQIKNTGFTLMKMGFSGVPSYTEWIGSTVEKNQSIGLDLECFPQESYEKLKSSLRFKNIDIKDINLIKEIWEDRPLPPKGKVYIYEDKYAGKTSKEKLLEVRREMKNMKSEITIISSLEDIAWLFNIRGSDIKYTPLVMSYAIVEEDRALLFVGSEKISNDVKNYLESFCELYNYSDIFNYVEKYENTSIYVDKNKLNNKLFNCIDKSNEIISGNNLTGKLKSIKNSTELANIEKAYIKDGVALTKFIFWIKKTIKNKAITEYEAELKLREFRKLSKDYIYDSFETISAYEKNAAMMHYHGSEENSSTIKNSGFLLVDSGAQYLEGTTDITRTISMGNLSSEEVRDFTYVLKSHIMLATCVFLKGTTGKALDSIARYNIWKNRTDYKSGTGHGIGCFLSVHEAPPSISPRAVESPMEVGMIVSNEPGIYREGKYGIRTENILEVVYDEKVDDDIFYKFNTISFAPIDIEAIDVNLLEDYEINALNSYHREVYNKISDYLTDEERKWLFEVTKNISK